MKTSQNSQATFLNETEFPLTSSRAVSPAKIYQQQESRPELEREPVADCGPNAYDLLASYNPDTRSLKTSQTCFLALLSNPADGLAEFSSTWPKRGMMQNGMLYRLASLVAGPNGRGFGLLPTVTKFAAKGAAWHRYYGSDTYQGNYQEYIRSSPDDPLYPTASLPETIMGYPEGWTELEL